MDPVSSATSRQGPWVRPVGEAAELASVLREGRMLAGEVLQTLAGGTVVIGLGRHRVAATSDGRLRPGSRHLFEVVSDGGAPELRVVAWDLAEGEDGLLRALRSALSAEQPLASLLENLASALEDELDGPPERRATLRRVLDALGARVHRPGAGGEALASALEGGGLAYEARWADLARRAAPDGPKAFSEAVRSFVAAELGDEGLVELLGAALRRAHAAPGAELARDLAVALERAADEAHLAGDARARLQRLDVGSWPEGMRRALARALLARDAEPAPTRAEVELAVSDLARDLKAELLRARSELEPGAARRAVERALAGLEAEQLLNVARAASHEPLQWCLPLRDGERWTTLRLYVHRDAREGAGGDGRATSRLALSVELSRVGPVHADLLLGERALELRILVAREEVAAALRPRLAELEQLLAFGGRPVHAALATAPEERLRAEDGVRDLALLRERSVLDLQG